MRCNWRRWLWGVIPLVAVALAAAELERAAIEQDLTERARHALAAKGAHWAAVNFSGRDVVLTGNAISDNEPREAEAVLRTVWGVGRIKSRAGLPKLVEPYVWKAFRRRNSVRLRGYYPDRKMRQTIVGMTRASLPGLEVVDRMHAARGVPPADTWLAGVSFALKQLASLKRGDVRLEGLALTISGDAENADAYRAVTAALKRGLPKGITLAKVQIAAPEVSPFTWSAEFAGGQLALSGYVTSEGARAELLAAARAVAGTDVVDRMEVARGAPSASAEAAAVLIKEIVRLQSGSAQMKDAAVVVGGVAADNAQAQAVRDSLRASLPAGFKLTDQVRVREPKVEPKAETRPAEQLAPAAPAEKKGAASAEPPAPAEKKDTASAAPSAPAEKKEAAPAEAPAPAEKKDTASAALSPPAEKKEVAPAEAPAPAETKDTASAAPSAPAEKKEPAPAEVPAPSETKDTASAAPSAPAERKEPAPAEAPAAAGKAMDTALLTPPAAAPQAPAEEKSAAPPSSGPETAPPAPAAKSAPAMEAKAKAAPAPPPKAEAAPPPKAEPAPAPKVEQAPPSKAADLAVCRSDLTRLTAANPVLFDRGSAEIDAASFKALDAIARAVKACPGVRLAAEGHTDAEGSPEHNQRLSLKRAKAVAEYLIEAGVAADLVQTAGWGTSRPVAPNTSAQTRAKNRRTEIVVRP
jgi:outer membrane protein OmpA-like peptidoglycan-associated protein